MIKRYEEIEHVMRHEMKGGKGTVERIPSVVPGEYESDAKVVTRLILKPGVSIGAHVHEQEEEIMTILAGTAKYTDQGKEVLLKAGDVAVCLSGQKHAVENASDTEDLEIFALVIGVPAGRE